MLDSVLSLVFVNDFCLRQGRYYCVGGVYLKVHDDKAIISDEV